jgi:hypothetical protein
MIINNRKTRKYSKRREFQAIIHKFIPKGLRSAAAAVDLLERSIFAVKAERGREREMSNRRALLPV